jgi:diphosphomevalonate decarboxylase
LCLCEIEKNLAGVRGLEFRQDIEIQNEDYFFKKASYYARIASGSASRSIYPKIAIWGETASADESSDEYAVPFYETIHPVFHTMKDAILIASAAEKAVSSTEGHNLMNTNRFAAERFRQAEDNMNTIVKAMQIGDLDTFGEVVEQEALTLHALMMTSSPAYILMTPNTLEMINRIKSYRKSSKIPLYFTLDAGPNIHLLYHAEYHIKVEDFIKSNLEEFCEADLNIYDQVGNGPQNLMPK